MNFKNQNSRGCRTKTTPELKNENSKDRKKIEKAEGPKLLKFSKDPT